MTGGFQTDGVSCPAAPCCADEGWPRCECCSLCSAGGDGKEDLGLWFGAGGVCSCRQGLRWSFKMALCSWRNVKQLVGRVNSTALSCLLQVWGGLAAPHAPLPQGGRTPIHGPGRGTGIYWESSQGTGGSRWQSGALGGEAAAHISALPHSERGVLRAGTGPALPRAGVDASAWAQPQRGGLNFSRGGSSISEPCGQVGLNREKGCSRPLCVGVIYPTSVTSRLVAPQDGVQSGRSFQPPPPRIDRGAPARLQGGRG